MSVDRFFETSNGPFGEKVRSTEKRYVATRF